MHGLVDQCDGQKCENDKDCHSGCCGHFVSFSVQRCLPLTTDSLCPRFVEPSITSPVPSNLPSVESTIMDMYSIKDRVAKLQTMLNRDEDDYEYRSSSQNDLCHSYGNEHLCDGLTCHLGSDCQSGCCAAFPLISGDYCQPIIEGACP